jgi:hypothetical protein
MCKIQTVVKIEASGIIDVVNTPVMNRWLENLIRRALEGFGVLQSKVTVIGTEVYKGN